MCHGKDATANNIHNADNNPGYIDVALDGPPGDPSMRGLRVSLNLTYSDLEDIANWIGVAPGACPVAGGNPTLQATPSPFTFVGSTAIGSTSATTTITITNFGTANALSVTASSGDATHFPISANSCSGITVGTVAGSNACSFNVAFQPTASGPASANITVNRTGGALTVGVSGTGSSGASAGQLTMNSSLGFGNQAVNTTSAASNVSVTNIGGSSVSVSSVGSNNPSEFAIASSTCTTVAVGGSCSIGVTFKPGNTGARSGSITVVSNGTGSPQAVSLGGTGTTAQSSSTVTVVEYHNNFFDHYFITPVAAEILLLDARAPPFQDWSRTGFSFNSYVNATAPGTSVAICRFFNSTFAPKSSHFYAPHGLGCEATIASFPDWKLEDDKLFNSMLPDSAGACPSGTIPVYRLYNNGMGGAPNHRFVTSLAERQNMLNKGYVAEGNGIGVGMCVPP